MSEFVQGLQEYMKNAFFFQNAAFFIMMFLATALFLFSRRFLSRLGPRAVVACFLAVQLGFLSCLLSALHLLLLVIFSLCIYVIGKMLNRKSVPYLAFVSMGFVVFFLVLTKYQFLGDWLNRVFPVALWSEITPSGKGIAILGVSYLSFKCIGFLVQCHGQTYGDDIDLLSFLCFIFFVPSFMIGPIDQYDRFRSELYALHAPSRTMVFEGLYRIMYGFFKKVMVAVPLGYLALGSAPASIFMRMGMGEIVFRTYLLLVVLYFDFSGYSDMAIGAGNLWGIQLPENFNQPYKAVNIQDFWNRFHMSLSTWFKAYLFFPIMKKLLSSKYAPPQTVAAGLASFATFLIIGTWHGDGVRFIVFGMLLGFGFSSYLLYRAFLEAKLSANLLEKYENSGFIKMLAWGITMSYISFCVIPFALDNDKIKLLIETIQEL